MSEVRAATGTKPVETPAPAAAARPVRPVAPRRIAARLLLVAGAGAILCSLQFPYWNLALKAPQYPKGLSLSIYPYRVTGDVAEIDGLNHYIGMRKIEDAAALERRLGIPAVITIAVLLVIAALLRTRWAVLLVCPALLFAPLFLLDLYWWLRDSGLNLDPKAAFSSSIKPFVPRMLGAGKIAQFRTIGSLDTGYYLAACAAIAALFYVQQTFFPISALWRKFAGKSASAKLCGLAMPAVCLLGPGVAAPAAEHVVAGGSTESLRQAIAAAAPGDTILVPPGVYHGPIVVRQSIRLIGQGSPVIDGRGKGTVVALQAPDIAFQGFRVRASGDLLANEDVGILATASGIMIANNELEDVLFGIYLRQSPRSVVRGNVLRGKELPVARRGDLIRLWYSDDVVIERNQTRGGRDAVLWYSGRLTIRDNVIRGGRYGLHFMYCNDAVMAGNRLEQNSVGAFLMYSRNLRLDQNWFVDNRGVSGYGIGLKDMEHSEITRNIIAANKVGLYLEHAQGLIAHNLVAGNDKGVILFPSATGNRIEANSFIENPEQVEIEGFSQTMTTNRWRANFWSDYRGYDLDGDGAGDLAYRPARLFERISDNAPALRLFAASPSAQAIDFAAGVFPIFEPKPKFADESPRMRPYPAPLTLASAGGSAHWLILGCGFIAWPLLWILGRTFVSSTPTMRINKPITAAATQGHAVPHTAAPAPAAQALTVENLSKRFGKTFAVDGVSFAAAPGQTIALWGANGAGKTTILRCILGLYPCSGSIAVMGHPCGPRGRASRQALGYVPQEVRLHHDDTVADTVRFYARLRKIPLEAGRKLIEEWGLRACAGRQVRQLSGGMKQKLALVVALLADPPVLLLDEPTSNLDARTRREFTELLVRLKNQGKTLLFCTHRPSEVWNLADRVIVLEQGRKVAEGSPEEVSTHLASAAHLGVAVPAEQAGLAAAVLHSAGFAVEQTRARLWVEVDSGRKIEVIDQLRAAGITILDFDLETEHAGSTSRERSTRGGSTR
jgi:nitrous oxidase accessory protein